MTLLAGGGFGSGGDPLSPEQEETLKYFKYSPMTNELEATRTISTLPSSLIIGNHKLTSGGENVFFKNMTTDINFFPAWSGIKDQAVPANQDETGVIPPSFRHFINDLFYIEPNSTPAPSGSVLYEVDTTVGLNVSIFNQEIIVEEDIAADDWLLYEQRVETGSDPVVYEQLLTGITKTAGDTLIWDFDHPVQFFSGQQAYASLKIAKGNQDAEYNLLNVRGGTTVPAERYVKVGVRDFIDAEVSAGIVPVSSDQKVRYSSEYAVDTSGGVVTLTVNPAVVNSFIVFDAKDNFNSNSCFVVIGLDTYELDRRNMQYNFYFDGTVWNWSRISRRVM